MITISEAEKKQKLEETLVHLRAERGDRYTELLESFASTVYNALPEWMAAGMSSKELSDRLWDNYWFFTNELPPPTQLYRGLPGLHVVVRNSGEEESLHTVEGRAIPMDTTIIETHTADAPFIFDSLMNYFRKAGLRVYSAIHPILTVRRQWERVVWVGGPMEEGDKELLCRFRIELVESKEQLRRVEHEIYSVLKCLFLALEDFSEMTNTTSSLARELVSRRSDASDLEAASAFLDWLTDENFILMGLVSYRITPEGTADRIPESSLGVFRDPALLPVVFPGLFEDIEGQLIPEPSDHRIVDIDYCSNASAIYHLEPIDDIVVRHWGEDGTLERATLILGRFSQGSFAQRAADVPILREKRRWLIDNIGAAPMSYAFRQVRALFNRFPRRDLFYAPVEDLKPLLERIVQITGDDEIAIHHRVGPDYVALYVAFSKIRYSYETETKLTRVFTERFGPIGFTASEDAGSVHLLIFYFDRDDLVNPISESTGYRQIEEIITTWPDTVSQALTREFGEREGRRLFIRWVTYDTRSGIYREATPAEEVPFDVRFLESMDARLQVAVVRRSPERATLKLYSLQSRSFIETLTTLRNLGLHVTGELEIPIRLPSRQTAHLHRYEIEDTSERISALVDNAERLGDALRAIDEERATDGDLNALVLNSGLDWREVEVLRTLRAHIQQIRPHYNQETVNNVLRQNSTVAMTLFRAFEARFDPTLGEDREAAIAVVEGELADELDQVANLVDDEVLRAFHNLILATVRTNFYQRPERPVLAMKVDSGRVEGMPSPRPMYEIYVHSRRIGGVHLRGGKVARGGIRWSDRHDDFRTEILDLVKTQMLKNSIIVPVGSKGGFVLKGELPPRPALDGYLIDRYREFISGLLDVTDNMVDGEVVHPPEVVRHDDDDPYLVVAADKGTAHLSDTANAVAKHYGFWLGDAFASGGSVGYDHKKVGITARGAWECIKHHFHNLGVDIARDPFTVAAIGDMGGDVFGNGMLLSRAIRLVAAFNHVHIFIDPNPDPEASFDERARLFKLPRSSWRDYDVSLISPGGGVFERSAKSIPLSGEVKKLLGVDKDRVSGEEMIRCILSAPVDLLYNGGIGTYVKASTEEHLDAGDRANDRVRVDASELRARVVGEGGNLGLTQKARLEYWAKGGIINTDAVDNSGGVDMSDHEVNIKILLDLLAKRGAVQGREERNRIFMEMTEDVAGLVLADNAAQALALTLDGQRSSEQFKAHMALLGRLVREGIMNASDDDIPPSSELRTLEDGARGLPRPLLALMLGHVKIWAHSEVLGSDFPESPMGRPLLDAYFPERLRESFADSFPEHPLRREIIVTAAVNHVVNHAGIDFLPRVAEATGKTFGEIVQAYLETANGVDATSLRRSIQEGERSAGDIHRKLLELEALIEHGVAATLRGDGETLGETAALAELRASLGV